MELKPIVDPPCPYSGEIPGGLQLGKMVRIQGIVHPNGDRFDINLQCGPNAEPQDDTALHLSVRLDQGYIARNHCDSEGWGEEDGSGTLPIGGGQRFEIIILAESNEYKIAINGQHFCEFKHRIPISKVTHLLINGQVNITLISWESCVPSVAPQSASQATQLNAQGAQNGPPPQYQGPGYDMKQPQGGYMPPQGGYGGPPQGGYGGPPQGIVQGGYGGPPQGGFGGPTPPSGYVYPGAGPMPTSAKQGGGDLDNFLASAQSVIAGAFQSGAAQQLLGSILSSGSANHQAAPGGFQPQNAQYGIYPTLPPQQQGGPQFGGQGPMYGGQRPPQQQESGGIGSFLSSLAGELLNPGPQQPQRVDHPHKEEVLVVFAFR